MAHQAATPTNSPCLPINPMPWTSVRTSFRQAPRVTCFLEGKTQSAKSIDFSLVRDGSYDRLSQIRVLAIASGHRFGLCASRFVGCLNERGPHTHFQAPLGIQGTVKLDELGHESGPTGLVTCAQSGAIVAMEVFKEVDVVAPEGIALEFLCAAIDWSAAMVVAQEDPGQPVRDLFAHLEEVQQLAGAGGTFDFEIVAVVQIEVQQRSDNERVHRHPDWSPPVGVAAEHAGVGLGRQVVYAVLLAVYV